MATRLASAALILLIAAIAAHASDNAAAPTAFTGDEKPLALTPFAQSPAMMQALSANDTDDGGDNDPDNGSLGSPQPVEKYGALDKSGVAAVGVSYGAAAFTVAAASGYLLF